MTDIEWLKTLDHRFQSDAPRLSKEVGITTSQAETLCATVHAEVSTHRTDVLAAWTDQMPIKYRLTTFERYQLWSTLENAVPHDADLPTERVATAWEAMKHVVHFYMSFVYLTDGFFGVLKEQLPKQGVTARCYAFMRDPARPVRHLRNAVSHGRWAYEPPTRLKYWDGPSGNNLTEYACSFDDLNFYMSLVTRTGWAGLAALYR